MKSKDIIPAADIEHYLKEWGWEKCVAEGRLMLLELISKAGAGYYNSHTEEGFMNSFGLLKKDRMPNRKGMKFINSMVYNHSNYRPESFELMKKFRREIK